MQLGAVMFCAILFVFFIFLRLISRSGGVSDYIPPGSPEVVIVTVLDDTLSKEYVSKIKENREDYAARHGGLSSSQVNFGVGLINVQVTKTSTLALTTTISDRHPSLGHLFQLYDMLLHSIHTPHISSLYRLTP